MADIPHVSKEVLTEFIEIYRSHPALWNVKSKEYVDRDLKNLGYDALVQVYRKVDPNANRDLVSKKIQSMRDSFREELRKFEKFNRSGASSDDQYVPSLWYFDLLMFTREHETSTESFDSMANSPSSSEEASASKTVDNLDEDCTENSQISAIEEARAVPTEEKENESNEMKTPFASTNEKSELGRFYREWQAAPPLQTFIDLPPLEELDLTRQLETFESDLNEYDTIVQSLCQSPNNN